MVAMASLVGLLIAVVGIALSLASVASSGGAAVGSSAVDDPIKTDPYSKGNPNAPVVVMEFSDFQCPACRIYTERIDPQFQKLYVDTGKVRFVARHFPFLGPESYTAAEAAEAAAEQGKFWAYTSLLWQRQGAENSGAFSAQRLKQFASEIGLDRKAFDEALDSGKHRAKVMEQKREGEALGINATPNFVVNGKKIQGVPSLATWASIIDQELGSKQ